jgi:hypothetical protein
MTAWMSSKITSSEKAAETVAPRMRDRPKWMSEYIAMMLIKINKSKITPKAIMVIGARGKLRLRLSSIKVKFGFQVLVWSF